MAATTVTVPAPRAGVNSGARRIWRAVRRNRKATAGVILLLFFCFLGLFPGLVAGDNPNAEIYGRSMGISGAHPLGTTAYGQDIFAQV
ncbi:MAG: hypothetical protein WB528_01755, partial [Bradyrhizobium sp.]